MQMQEWIRTMVLMAIARVLSPEQDSPGSVVVAEWSSRQRHFSPPFLLGGRFRFDRFRIRFLEFSTKDSSPCVPVVMHSDLPVDS